MSERMSDREFEAMCEADAREADFRPMASRLAMFLIAERLYADELYRLALVASDLSTALVNAGPNIAALWEADEWLSSPHIATSAERQERRRRRLAAVEALRPLFGGDAE